jgi:TATA-box binding protein (TBP) (component of TFIID and TFIIIB)
MNPTSKPRIVNVIVVGTVGHCVNLEILHSRVPNISLLRTRSTDQGPRILTLSQGRSVVTTLHANGRAVCTGARSITEAKKALQRAARLLGLRCFRDVEVVNIVAEWTLPARATQEQHRLEQPKAFVRIRTSGHVYCMGTKNREQLKQVHRVLI